MESYISDHFDMWIGGTPSRSNEEFWDGSKITDNKWVSIRDLKKRFISETEEYISDLGVRNSNVKLIPKDTVLMSFKLSIGRLAITTSPLYTNEAIVAFVAKSRKLADDDYLYYGLQSWNLLIEVDQAVKGVTLNKEKMSRIFGLFPPLPEQKKIASILTSVDEVIETTQKQIDKLQDLKKATMNELLTKGIGHTEFKDSALGRIPKSWEVKRLDEVSLEKGIQTGPFGSQLHAHEYTTDGVPVVMPKDMKPPLIDISDIARIPEHRAIDLSKHRVKKGDILFSRRGDIGRFALMEASSEGWVCGTGCLRVRLKNGVVHPYFIAQYLTKDEPKEWLNLNAVGLTMLNLSTSILEGLPLIEPSMEEQMTIVSALQSIDARLSKCRDYLSQTQSLKKSLMQDLLTGKVRVEVN